MGIKDDSKMADNTCSSACTIMWAAADGKYIYILYLMGIYIIYLMEQKQK